MFRYGLRAHDLGKFASSAIVPAIRNAGFDGIQCAPRKLVEGFPDSPSSSGARALGALLRDGGIRVDILGCYIDPAHPDESARAAARFAADIRLCRDYGAAIIATETGRPWNLSGQDGSPTSGAHREFDIMVRNFRTLAAIALEEGVTIAVEPVWEHILSTPALVRDFVDAVGSPALGLLLDPCNLVSPAHCEASFKSGTTDGKLPGLAAPALETISLLGGLPVAVHAKDFLYANGVKKGATCGEGLMDWKTVLSALCARNGAPTANPDTAGASGAAFASLSFAVSEPSIPVIIEEQAPGRHARARDFLMRLI